MLKGRVVIQNFVENSKNSENPVEIQLVTSKLGSTQDKDRFCAGAVGTQSETKPRNLRVL